MKNKVDGLDATKYVSKIQFEKDIKDLDDSINQIGKKIPDVSNLATKSSIASLLITTTFNSKITNVK